MRDAEPSPRLTALLREREPLLILTGAGGSLLSHSARRNLMRVAAVCVMITGLISLARGVMFVQYPGSAAVDTCPFCR